MSLGKVMALFVGLLMLGALAVSAGAQFYGGFSPFGLFGPGGLGGMGGLSSIYGPYGPFSMMGLGGMGGRGSPFSGYSYGYGNSPYYGSPSGYSYNGMPPGDLFSGFGQGSPLGDLFGGSAFKAKQYGPPPEDNITRALVGQKLSYNSGYMGIPLQYQVEESDIGDITGTQYRGADAWKVRVGQPGAYWDVIMDKAGNKVLSATQVR